MSRYSDEQALQLNIETLKHQKDIPALQNLWKRIAAAALEKNNINAFLNAAYSSIYAEQIYSPGSNYKHAVVDQDLTLFCKFVARELPVADWLKIIGYEKRIRSFASELS